jgi:hypothetical protein
VDNFRNKLETTEHLSWLGEWFSASAWRGRHCSQCPSYRSWKR